MSPPDHWHGPLSGSGGTASPGSIEDERRLDAARHLLAWYLQVLGVAGKEGGRTTERVRDGSVDLGPLVGRWAARGREER